MKGKRRGFTLVETVIAATVLVIALFGILGSAFTMYRKSDTSSDAIKAAHLAADRLNYFRSQRQPHQATGGTFYAPPDSQTLMDLNLPIGNNRTQLHNVWNDNPVLLVREYLYDTTAKRVNALGVDEGYRNQQDAQNGNRVNFVPDIPATTLVGGVQAPVTGVFPNPGNAGAPATETIASYATGLQGGSNRQFVYVPAPRANDNLRGAKFELPPTIRFVREVWVQSNSPLGAPFQPGASECIRNVGVPALGFYTTTQLGGAAILNDIRRARQTGTAQPKVPLWMNTVTIRVFARFPGVRSVSPDGSGTDDPATSPDYRPVQKRGSNPATDPAGYLGYDPRRPLAMVVGYFGIRSETGLKGN